LQVAHWITFKEEQRLDWQKAYLARLCEADPQIRETYELIQEFTTLLREREGERLDEWLDRVEKQGRCMAEAASNSCASGFCIGRRPRGVCVERKNSLLERSPHDQGTLE
jgi:hypothetical protein